VDITAHLWDEHGGQAKKLGVDRSRMTRSWSRGEASLCAEAEEAFIEVGTSAGVRKNSGAFESRDGSVIDVITTKTVSLHTPELGREWSFCDKK
jgi:hypothetical protein